MIVVEVERGIRIVDLSWIIAVSDVVVENFAAGIMERMGLGYDVLSAHRPDLIMVSSSGTGHSGLDRDFVGYASLLQHYTGLSSISGHPEESRSVEACGPIHGSVWSSPWSRSPPSIIAP